MSEMSLLVITELFLPTKGGTAVWAAEVYGRLGGKEIHVVTADAPRAFPEGVVAWLAGRITLRKVVVYALGEELTSWGNGLKYRAMRFVLCHVDAVIANSEFTRKELLRMGVPDQRISLINPGVDILRF